MLTLLTLIVSVGLADSIDPTMILPAVYFASRPDGDRSAAKFAGGVFTVNVIGGVAIVLGQGRFLLSLAPHLGSRTTHRLELAAGALLLVAAVVLWLRRPCPRPATHERSPHAAFLVGATIALAELPTALPYFVVIVAVIRAQEGIASTVALLSAYQVLLPHARPRHLRAQPACVTGRGPREGLRRRGHLLAERCHPCDVHSCGCLNRVSSATAAFCTWVRSMSEKPLQGKRRV